MQFCENDGVFYITHIAFSLWIRWISGLRILLSSIFLFDTLKGKKFIIFINSSCSFICKICALRTVIQEALDRRCQAVPIMIYGKPLICAFPSRLCELKLPWDIVYCI